MARPLSYFSITIADNTQKSNGDPELTTSEVPITTMTPANAAAVETAAGNLSTALAAITLGRFVKNTKVYARNQSGAVIPADDPLAQRENKWLCRYHDVTNFEKFTVSYGTADLSLLAGHSEFLDLTGTEGAAFKSAFEAVVVSPSDASHAVVLDSVQFVGRNT